MKNLENHITIEEAVALADGRYSLLPQTEEHLEQCPECSAMIKDVSDCKEIFAGEKNFVPEIDSAKVAEIAAKSFEFLPFEEENEPEKVGKFDIFSFFTSWFKPVFAFSMAVVFIVAAVFVLKYEKTDENIKETVEVAETSGVETVPETVEKPAEDFVPGVKKSGRKIKLAKAKISVVSDTYFEKIENEDVSMKSGKAKFDVVSGNDFRIDVDDKFLVRVLGTSFTLDYSEGRLSAEVFSGLVEIVEKSNGAVTQLSQNMNRTFEVKALPKEPASALNHNKNTFNKKGGFMPDKEKSFLFQGRAALAEGKTEAAEKLFMMEIEKGREADKALFELVSINESKKDYTEMAKLVKKYDSIMRGSRVYKEELMIKGCVSQKKSGDRELPLCRDYLKEFPRSFRSREIREMINE